MMIQAHNLIGSRHDQMQIMGNHEYTTSVLIPDFTNELIQFGLSC
jgi:hypothetical protein